MIDDTAALQPFGRYQLLAELGQGAMGKVYLAFDPALDRQVALKTITLPTLPGSSELRRFRREVRVAARLNHPNIVSIYDVDLDHDPPYMVMEFLAGGTLETYLKERRLPWAAALALLQPICQALAHAHQAGVIHRDVKPGNILFISGDDRTVKLTDFGLARLLGSERLTSRGGILGTIAYMSPEQANGEEIDAASDIFSLGVILFEAITGHNPLRGQTVSETLARVSSPESIDLAPLGGLAPQSVLSLIQKALARDRRERYNDCRLLAQDIAYALGQTVAVSLFPAAEPASPELQIESAPGLTLPPGAAEILRAMYAGYGRLAVKAELWGGRSGSRVFLVRPIRDDGMPELPAVVKMAPVYLIQQEWRAYHDYIHAQWASVAEIQGEPVLPIGGTWGGLRYPLVGGGDFEVQSLSQYYCQASAADLRYVLEQRLFRRVGEKWRHNYAAAEFRLGHSYDPVLPVNLLIQSAQPEPGAVVHLVRAGAPIDPSLRAGDHIQARGFFVTEVDEANQTVTLDRPADSQLRFFPACRLRLQSPEDIDSFRVGQPTTAEGVILATRHDLLLAQAQEALGPEIDLAAVGDTLPNGWPNPLARLPAILSEAPNVRTANIHGDFNLENILVDPGTREIYLIDFALARRDHVLHDLLRLEKDVVTRLLPGALAEAELPPQAMDSLYRLISQAVAKDRFPAVLPHPALEKPLAVLFVIRRTARDLLFDPQQWQEYNQGLSLYLLGALKFRDLDRQAKETAFWAAAALQHLLTGSGPADEDEPATSAMARSHRRWFFWRPGTTRILLAALILTLVLAVPAVAVWRASTPPGPSGPQLATILSFDGDVEVRQGGSRLQPVFGMPLYESDLVITSEEASARVFCENGLIFELPADDTLVVNCQDSEDPRIISSSRPGEDGDSPLTPAAPGEGSTAALVAEEAEIRAYELDEVAKAYLLAKLYRKYGLTDLAIERLESLVAGPNGASPYVWRELGALYTELGRSTEAEESYAAAAAAESTATAQAQATVTREPDPTVTPRPPTPTTAATLTPVASPTPVPELPVQLGTPVPQPAAAISPANAGQLVALAIWATSRPIFELACLPDGHTLATASNQGAYLYDIQDPAQERFLYVGQVNSVDFSTDGQWLITGSLDATIGIWQVADKTLFDTISGHTQRIWSVAFAPDGETLASGSHDNTVRLWQTSDGTPRTTLTGHTGPVRSVAYSPDGQTLASGSDDGTVRLWNTVDGTLLGTLSGHRAGVRSVAFSPDGGTVASGSDDGTTRLWQVSNGMVRHTLEHGNTRVYSVAFAPDGQTLATGSADTNVRLWRVSDGQRLATLIEPAGNVYTVAFCNNGRLLVSASSDGTIFMWAVPP
jgi:serine/threonine protein kinase